MPPSESTVQPAVPLSPPRPAPATRPDAPPATSAPEWSASAIVTGLPAWAEQNRLAIFLLIALAYLAGFTGRWRATSDGTVHLAIARSLARGAGFHHPLGDEAATSPGLAYAVAATFRAFGFDHLAPAHALLFAAALATLALCYWLFTLHLGRGVAVLLLALLAATETCFRYAFILLPDMPFLLGAAACLVGLERLEQARPRPWMSWALVAAGIVWMALFRSVVAVFTVAVLAALTYQVIRARQWRILGLAAAIALTLLAARFILPGTSPWKLSPDERILQKLVFHDPAQTLHHIATDNLPALLTETASEAAFGVDASPYLALPLSLLVLGAGLALFRVRPVWGALVAAFVAQWLIFVVADRYFLVLMPLLLIGWWRLCSAANARLPQPWGGRVALTLLLCWFVPNLAMSIKVVAEQHDQLGLTQRSQARELLLTQLADALRELPPTAIATAHHEVADELMWHADRTIYPSNDLPTAAARRNRIVVVEPADASLTPWLRKAGLTRRGKPLCTVTDPEHTWTITSIGRPVPPGK